MNKKSFLVLIFLSISILIVLTVRGCLFQENHQGMGQLYSGDDYSHWFHLRGIVLEKTSNTLLVRLMDEKESTLFFDKTEVSLDCTKCETEVKNVSKGDIIQFYFFKQHAGNGIVKVEKVIGEKEEE
ncbi:hypothetical protein ACKX2L_05855 [Lachnospiraceae bacterium YH-ros2228]